MKNQTALSRGPLTNFLFAFFPFLEKKSKLPFTYYIPGPPQRKSGYQEKEFDKIMENILKTGMKIIKMETQSHLGKDQSGVWVFFILEGTQKAIESVRNLDTSSQLSSAEEQIFVFDEEETLTMRQF